MKVRYLIDTSAMVRASRSPEVARVVGPLVSQGAVAVSSPALLEIMYATRATDYERTLSTFRTAMPILPLDPTSCSRALDVQQSLARTSQHRTAKVVDLLIAACAETNKLTVLHYDRDFDAIAAVTMQPVMWVVPPGTVP